MGEQKRDFMMWVCQACYYVYDRSPGDFDSGMEAGTSLEDLPEDRVCPVCGAGKQRFEKGEK